MNDPLKIIVILQLLLANLGTTISKMPNVVSEDNDYLSNKIERHQIQISKVNNILRKNREREKRKKEILAENEKRRKNIGK